MALLTDRNGIKKGYTLIELIVVVALFSLLISITLPNTSIVRSFNENHELRMIQKDLRQARNMAILENRTVSALFFKDGNQYIIRYKEGDNIKWHKLRSGLKIVDVGSTTYIFNETGRVGNANSILLKKSNGRMYKIAIQVNTATISIQEVN